MPSLIATAHRVCRKLDGGTPADSVVDDLRKEALTVPGGLPVPERRIVSTITRFITASVEAYCPDDRGKIISIMASRAAGVKSPISPRRAGTGSGAAASLIAVPPPPQHRPAPLRPSLIPAAAGPAAKGGGAGTGAGALPGRYGYGCSGTRVCVSAVVPLHTTGRMSEPMRWCCRARCKRRLLGRRPSR
ncbi:MAG: DUF732 domain-containing protein [Mycobacterium sp.]|nr:DUF732 domain-containing protein [Mycobacterium sp.]